MEVICELKNITKTYGKRNIFKDFNLVVKKGEMICISGKSGSGKSTLLNMIGMFEKPDSGSIELFGTPLPDINSKLGRELMENKIFYLFQNFALIDNQSISYNLDIPLFSCKKSKKEKEKMKKEALKKVGLTIDIKEKIYHLSGGEQQRVALARGFLKDFDLILADEPTGSLDGENRDAVLNILDDFQKQGKTVLIVTHDPMVMEHCQKIIKI